MSVSRFEGRLVSVPFGRSNQAETVRREYQTLLDGHDSEDVLVIAGAPTSTGTYRDLLDDLVPGAAVPNVTSVVVHATSVVKRTTDRAVLSDALRTEILHRFLDGREYDSTYLQHAAEQESFVRDLAGLMETVVWQGSSLSQTPDLVEIGELVEEFHEWLAEHDHLERGQLIGEATTALAEPASEGDIVDADAILAVEFEEFFPQDRRYLSNLSADRDLVCVAVRDSSVRRTWMEPRSITDVTEFADVGRSEAVPGRSDADPSLTRPQAIATYLARGDIPTDPGEGTASIIASTTPDEQLASVANEIEALRDQEGWAYEDVAVALKHRGETVTETVRELERAGIPTRSATTIGFGDDPAVRELLHVARSLAADEADREESLAAHPELDSELLERVADTDGLEAGLRRWATMTDLKGRIASEAVPLDARSRFGNVTRAFEMASFVEETPFLVASWDALAQMLERAHERSPRFARTSAIDREGGVRVDDIQSLKNGAFRAVFLLNVVDGNYPGAPSLSRLFPRERVQRMPDYPGVTDVDPVDVGATFATDSTEADDPFRRYHAEHSRRLLATGAGVATERCYLCFYTSEGAGLDERVQPSRFLTGAYRDLPWLGPTDEGVIRSEHAAEEYLLSLVDRTLSEVRRAHSREVSVSLDEVESDLVAIQDLLDASGERGQGLRDALRARIDLADGRVRRE